MNTVLEYIDDLESVRKRIAEIRDGYGMYYGMKNEDDIRYSYLNQLYRLIMSYDFGLVDFYQSTCGKNKVRELFKVENPVETSEILLDYFSFLKIGFIYSLTSLTENYFRSIFRELLSKKDLKIEFYGIREQVFKVLKINTESDAWKALSLLSNIRNCIHNNGIYRSTRTKIEIDYHGRRYVFSHGEAQNSADPATLILILNDILSIVEEINSKVKYAKDISSRRTHRDKRI